jgi:hypothetical protein
MQEHNFDTLTQFFLSMGGGKVFCFFCTIDYFLIQVSTNYLFFFFFWIELNDK